MRMDHFPHGTGFDDSSFRLVICMTSRMSQHLLSSKHLSIDTSFKCVQGWQEFEIESWDDGHMRSMVSARAMTTSQTAEAHLILFQQIFEIATQDTGVPVAFRHIHGFGIESIIADGHRGQAKALHSQVSKNVYNAMLSLASAEAHPNIQTTLSIIRRAWLKDKESSKFALPAIYWPMSLIPIAIWKASPTTTNGNEQAHRNINRDGINLTLLAGIMRGYQYDVCAASSIDLHIMHGINTRDNESTHLYQAKRSVSRQKTMNQISFPAYKSY
ncbi:hypothetical protein C8R48DRAFT_672460 [Suillus tomentosus]|nr:hypothetical protein C8R48DRAFT_672460 [Suillus tomentosus]